MAFYEMLPGAGMPPGLQAGMDSVLNKKFGTSTTYPAEDWPDTVNLMGPLPEKTASGTIAHFDDGADAVPIKSWEVEIAPTLTGKSAVECTQTGKNLYVADLTQDGANRVILYDNIYLPIGNYYISLTTSGTVASFFMKKHSGGSWSNVGGYTKTEVSVTISEADYYGFSYYISTGVTASDISNVQLEVGMVKTDYETPTVPTVSTVNLGRTIYGGTADVVNGTGSGEWATVKLKDLTWYYSTSYGGFFHSPSIQSVVSDETYICVSSEYTNVRLNSYRLQNTDDAIGINADNGSAVTGGAPLNSIVVKDTDYTTVADLIAHFTANDSTLCYKLATLTDFTFTPITPTPETALGVNNFWADEGDTSVTYRADINLALGGN